MKHLTEFLDQEKDIAYIHLAPACGTASRAREKPLPNMTKQGAQVAKPLRSTQYPEGLPGLSHLDKLRTETANQVYANSAAIVLWAHEHKVVTSVENPESSIFWLMPCVQDMRCRIGGFPCVFDNCCHGGLRKKSTQWWCTHDWFSALAIKCNGGHYHEPWAPTLKGKQLVYPMRKKLHTRGYYARELQEQSSSAC